MSIGLEKPEGYLFGDYELNLVRGCLIRGGVEQTLRRQTLRVLQYLLERPGELVSKDAIASAIWHDVAVTDNALVQCIAEIRRALGDDSRNSRYIKTVPRLGYRLLEEVRPLPASQAVCAEVPAAPDQADESLIPDAALAVCHPVSGRQEAVVFTPLFSPARRLITVALCSLVLFLAVVIRFERIRRFGGHFGTPGTVDAGSVSNRPSIAVLYFSNETGDQHLNWLCEGLADMMIANLAPSEGMNVVSREQLHSLFPDGAESHGNSAEEITRIGQRAHVTTVVLGSFAGSEQNLRLDLQVYDAKTGRVRAREQAIVEDPQEIVIQANLLSARVAGDVGLAPLPQSSLPDVMTTNVEAYRYYSLGVEKAHDFENVQAIQLLKKAIQFDPAFAMAYARIGYAYAVTDFVPARGRPYLEKALQLSNSLSAKDRLYVSAWNAIAQGEYGSAISTLNQIVETWPGESEGYCQLARLLRGEEKDASAIAVLQRGLQANPNSANLYNVLSVVLLGEHRYTEAIEAARRYAALSPSDPNSHDSLGMAYEQSGDYFAAISEYSAALNIDPEFEPAIVHLGDTYFQQGRYRESIQEYQRYIQVTNSDAARAIGYGDIATVDRAMGDLNAAQSAANMEMKRDPTAVWDAILVALDRGETAKVSSLERLLLAGKLDRERGTQPDLRTQFYNRGYLALSRGDARGAIMNFQIALQHLPATSGIDLHEDCLANAYLQLGMWTEAVKEYQRVLKGNPNYPLAEFHLAEAYSHLHEIDKSRQAYALFLQSWQAADPNSREVKEARADIAA